MNSIRFRKTTTPKQTNHWVEFAFREVAGSLTALGNTTGRLAGVKPSLVLWSSSSHVLSLMLESVRGEPGPESALSFKYNLGSVCRRLYFYTGEIINVDGDNARSFTRRYSLRARDRELNASRSDDADGANDERTGRSRGGRAARPSHLSPAPAPSPPADTTRPPPCNMHRCLLQPPHG